MITHKMIAGISLIFVFVVGCSRRKDRESVSEFHAYGKIWKRLTVSHSKMKPRLFTGHGIISGEHVSWADTYLITPDGVKLPFQSTILILQKNGMYRSYDKYGVYYHSSSRIVNYNEKLYVIINDLPSNLTDCFVHGPNRPMTEAESGRDGRGPDRAELIGELRPDNHIFYVDEFVAQYDEKERVRHQNSGANEDYFLLEHKEKFCKESN